MPQAKPGLVRIVWQFGCQFAFGLALGKGRTVFGKIFRRGAQRTVDPYQRG
jgi:hypothetical protein